MPLGFNLAHLIAIAMVLAAVAGWIRWPRLDRPGRWLVASLTISVAFLPPALWMLMAARSTRLLFEAEMLVATSAMLVAFVHWQLDAGRRRGMLVLGGLWLLAWTAAQAVQGTEASFSYASAPMAGLVKVGAGGYTLVTRVQATRERWTDQLWFWASVAVMIIYGTAVILDPVWLQLFGGRNDLAVVAFGFNVVGSVIGYGLLARGLWRAGGSP